jgi:nitrile hydratase accessory protein
MFTRFEEYAATQMLGHIDSPPREQGKLFFSEEWQRTLFGLTLALSKEGHFEWEDFRQKLIQSIGNWEDTSACQEQPPWDYYDRFFEALMEVLKAHDLLDRAELQGLLESGV